jgi:hypothetical protein
LNTDKYEDNNNYFRINEVSFYKTRFALWNPTDHYRFLDYNISPRWTGPAMFTTDNSSYNQGKTFKKKKIQKLFGSYFFLSEELIKHDYTGYTVLDVLSGFGGMYRLLCMYLAIVAMYFNKPAIMAKFIRGLYFIEKPKKLRSPFSLGKKKYSKNLMTIRVDFFNKCCKYSRDRKTKMLNQKKIYDLGMK